MIAMVFLWALAGTGVALMLLLVTKPKLTWQMLKDGLDGLQMIQEIGQSYWQGAQSWRRRYAYSGTHRAERFQITPVMYETL